MIHFIPLVLILVKEVGSDVVLMFYLKTCLYGLLVFVESGARKRSPS